MCLPCHGSTAFILKTYMYRADFILMISDNICTWNVCTVVDDNDMLCMYQCYCVYKFVGDDLVWKWALGGSTIDKIPPYGDIFTLNFLWHFHIYTNYSAASTESVYNLLEGITNSMQEKADFSIWNILFKRSPVQELGQLKCRECLDGS